jgi:hypothetical protein
MTRARKRFLNPRLLALCLMLGALMLIAPKSQTSAVFKDCNDPFQDCTCEERFDACYAKCYTGSEAERNECIGKCQDAYAGCLGGAGGGGNEQLPPDGPCPGCTENCDMQQLICVNEGIDTPMNCARIAQRCRMGCYQGCSQ